LKSALAIFVKTPGISPVKTRLAQSIGKRDAEFFFHLCIKVLEQFAQDVYSISRGNIQPFWAIGEEGGVSHKLWQKLPRIYTGPGEMGNRLFHVYSTLLKDYEAVILVGADSPHIKTSLIIHIHERLLRKHKFILGPTLDGGFYLFAGRAPIEKKYWFRVKYSTNNTSHELIQSLQPLGKTFKLDFLVDVDGLGDLTTLLSEMEKSQSPYLMDLKNWIKLKINP